MVSYKHMRDDAQFFTGKKTTNDSLEFVGSKKKSLFAQYTAQFQQSASSLTNKKRAVIEAPQLEHFQPRQSSVNYEEPTPEVGDIPDEPLPTGVKHFLDDSDDALKGVTHSSISRPHKEVEARKAKKKRNIKIALSSLGVLTGLAVIAISVSYIKSIQPAVTNKLRASFAFPIYEIPNNNSFVVDKKSVSKGENSSIVYVAQQKDDKSKFVVSQQAIPEVLKSEGQYQEFLTQTDKYASMDSSIGKAYFTKPPSIGDDISVVIKTDTTLLFIRGNGATAEEDWSKLISLLNIAK